MREFGRNLIARIARPALGRVEGDDADGRRILALKQMADQCRPVGVGHVGLGPGQAPERAGKVIEHKIDRPIEVALRDNRW